MIRTGTYALYNGNEYRFRRIDDQTIRLISNNKSDTSKGFVHLAENVYTMDVRVSKIDDLYYIYSDGIYKGNKFGATEGSKGKVLLSTPDAQLAEQYDFDRTDKYLYSKYVDYSEVEIVEETKPYSLD
ncbi:hypothetical protein [Pseudalkalibacillus decolorationis]|uniref:hypothetical protein n=1 Tax=Pseudalkalibacillus decolorationis TaxID=163879 RepID=UPI002149379E|nr:hypothetical protein [Pseudalkalibacillus decolorationis]